MFIFKISLTCLFFCAVCTFGKNRTLHVGVLLELSENWYAKYTNFFPTMFEYAFQRIKIAGIMKDYEFKLIIKDTKGEAGLAARQLTELLDEDPPKVAIIGPTLSDSLTVTGQIVPFYKVIELSYIAITATTVHSDLYSTLFKVNQVTDAFNPLRIKIMKHFGWSRVATLTYQEEISYSQIANFQSLLRENNMTLVTSAVISEASNFRDILKRFKQFGVRIIVGAFRTSIAPQLFCEAYHQHMYGNSHVWILSGPTLYDRWQERANVDDMNCTMEQLIKATEGHFTTNYVRESAPSKITVSGQTKEEVMNDMRVLVSNTSYTLSSSVTWIYDTPWALALGLNNSLKYLEKSELDLQNYNYNDTFLDAVVKGMKEVQFQGISGPVAFDDTGSRIGITNLKQHFHEQISTVATYDKISDILTWFVDSSTLWSGNEVPKDRFTYQDVLVAPSSVSFGLIVTLDCLGCILSFALLFFNIFYRNNTVIKMSSPMVNNVIIVGCMLIYLEIFVNAVVYYSNEDGITGSRLCMVRVWLLSLGFTILFGALFTKTYRVYVVFRDQKMKPMKDYHLFGMVGIMLVIDVSILVPWTLFFPLQKIRVTQKTMDEFSQNMIIFESYLHCFNENSVYWIAAMYVYKGLLLAFGVFLAWETRHITIPMLNDSKYIGACIYNVVVACIFGVPLAHVLPIEQMTLKFVLESCLLFFCTTSSQCIIFIPKMKMRNQIQGRFVTSMQVPPETAPYASNSSGSKSDSQTYDDMKKEIAKLKLEKANESIAVAKLRKAILHRTGNIHFYKSGSEYVVCKLDGLVSASKLSFDKGTEADNKRI